MCIAVKVDGYSVAYKETMQPSETRTFVSSLKKDGEIHEITISIGLYVPEYDVCSVTGGSETADIQGDAYVKIGYYGDIYIREWK